MDDMIWNYKALQLQADGEFGFTSKILNDLVRNKSNVTVLDVGCSDGYNTIKVWGKYDNVKVVGIDISQDAIQIAKNRPDKCNVVFECVDIENISELDNFYSKYGKFDIVYCSHLIQHLKDVTEFIKKVHYFLLKLNGYFVIKTIDDSTKHANQQDDILQYVLQYYQDYVAPFQKHRRYTNRYIGENIPELLDAYYQSIICYRYQQTTEGSSQEDRSRLYDKCFHFRELNDCIRKEIMQDKDYLDGLAKLKKLFIKDDYIFCTETLLFVAQNKS